MIYDGRQKIFCSFGHISKQTKNIAWLVDSGKITQSRLMYRIYIYNKYI